jgi:hypothetical protein
LVAVGTVSDGRGEGTAAEEEKRGACVGYLPVIFLLHLPIEKTTFLSVTDKKKYFTQT